MDLLGAIVAANPCPPLPLICKRVNRSNDSICTGYGNTHHVLMQAYTHAMKRANPRDDARREKTQIDLTRTFMHAFSTKAHIPKAQDLYEAATTFTREYLHSFMPDRQNMVDARFAPYEEICYATYSNNPICRAACEHLSGMISYDEAGVVENARSFEEVLSSLKDKPFSELLSKYAEVHTGRNADEREVVEILE